MFARTCLLAVVCLLANPALAQLRTIPDAAKRGEMRHVQEMIVAIDGGMQRLSPGAQVRDAGNRLIVPSAIPAGSLVKYLLNDAGQVHRVWILSPEEAARRDKPQ
jgi:hypothetical protein